MEMDKQDEDAFYSEFVTPEHFVDRVGLDDYIERRFPDGDPVRRQKRHAEVKQDYLARFVDGDEWWEWRWGEDGNSIWQEGGLALVRDGKVVWATADWVRVLNT